MARNTYQSDSPLRVVTCPVCGLIFVNPQYSEAAYADFYSSSYYRDVAENELQRNRAELGNSYLRHYKDVLGSFAEGLKGSDRILDIGSGYGTWLRLLFRFSKVIDHRNVTALEPSSDACNTLRRRFPEIAVVQEVLSSAGLTPASFDAIICGALIEHLTDPLEGLVEMNRLLTNGGRLLLVTPSAEPRSFRFGLNRFFKFVHTTYFTAGTLTSMLEKAGFEVVRSRIDRGNDLGMLWCPTILLVARKARPVDAAARSVSVADEKNAVTTAALFENCDEAEVTTPHWRALLMKIPRAAYRYSMPRL